MPTSAPRNEPTTLPNATSVYARIAEVLYVEPETPSPTMERVRRMEAEHRARNVMAEIAPALADRDARIAELEDERHGTLDRRCVIPGCAASYNAAHGPAPDQRWLRTSSPHLLLCPDHTHLLEGDTPHTPRLDHTTRTCACSCGHPLPGPTLGHMATAWTAHALTLLNPRKTDTVIARAKDNITRAAHRDANTFGAAYYPTFARGVQSGYKRAARALDRAVEGLDWTGRPLPDTTEPSTQGEQTPAADADPSTLLTNAYQDWVAESGPVSEWEPVITEKGLYTHILPAITLALAIRDGRIAELETRLNGSVTIHPDYRAGHASVGASRIPAHTVAGLVPDVGEDGVSDFYSTVTPAGARAAVKFTELYTERADLASLEERAAAVRALHACETHYYQAEAPYDTACNHCCKPIRATNGTLTDSHFEDDNGIIRCRVRPRRTCTHCFTAQEEEVPCPCDTKIALDGDTDDE